MALWRFLPGLCGFINLSECLLAFKGEEIRVELANFPILFPQFNETRVSLLEGSHHLCARLAAPDAHLRAPDSLLNQFLDFRVLCNTTCGYLEIDSALVIIDDKSVLGALDKDRIDHFPQG